VRAGEPLEVWLVTWMGSEVRHWRASWCLKVSWKLVRSSGLRLKSSGAGRRVVDETSCFALFRWNPR
jgi:hypothetical protein